MWEGIETIVTSASSAMGTALLEQEQAEEGPKHVATNCFHILGFDIIFNRRNEAVCLEVNCSPSLAVDSVYPITGTAAQAPPAMPSEGPYEELMHHRPHFHSPCAVDVVVKTA